MIVKSMREEQFFLFSRMKRHVLQFAPRDARDVRRRVPVARSSGESPLRAVIVARALASRPSRPLPVPHERSSPPTTSSLIIVYPSMCSRHPQAPALRARASLARRAVRPRGFFTVRAAAAPPCECEIEGDSRVAKVNGKDVSAAALRDVSVMDRRGATTNLGEQIGDKGVLVLLRHLG